MSMVGLLGDRSEGLRAVSGIRSSLVLSFFSYEAKVGSLSVAPPFAPLTIGIVGCTVDGGGPSLFCLL